MTTRPAPASCRLEAVASPLERCSPPCSQEPILLFANNIKPAAPFHRSLWRLCVRDDAHARMHEIPIHARNVSAMRTHGWGGAKPASDEEAVERILDAASRAIEERGGDMRIADVARTLGVSRQTVYNYFPGTNTLIEAAANRSGMRFLDRLAHHLTGISDPVDALVESL